MNKIKAILKKIFIKERTITMRVSDTFGFEVGDKVRLVTSKKKGTISKIYI